MATHTHISNAHRVRNVKCKEHDTRTQHKNTHNKRTHARNTRKDTAQPQQPQQPQHIEIEYIHGTNTPKLRISKELKERTNRYTEYKAKYDAQRRRLWWTSEQYAQRKCSTYGSRTEGKRYATTRTLWHKENEQNGKLYPAVKYTIPQYKDTRKEHGIVFIYDKNKNSVVILKGDIQHNGERITMKIQIKNSHKKITAHATRTEFYNEPNAPQSVAYKGEQVPLDMLVQAILQYRTDIYTLDIAYKNTQRRMTKDEILQYRIATGQLRRYEPNGTQEETEEEKMAKINAQYEEQRKAQNGGNMG